MAKSINQFQTIRSEGAVLPPDILQKISSLKVEGATVETYHLPPETKISEAISQSWNALRSHWGAFQEIRTSISEDDTGTKETNERWLLPLFKELDYGRLLTEKSPVIEERVYPIERFYNHTPIHLIGCNLPLDRRTKGARGAATASPHSMVQEFLNRSDEHLWAFLCNGLQLRILRDNVSLSRQAYVEFDLEAMMEGEVYADFALLWLLCHQSRVEAEKAENCWLEKWSHLAREQGTRVLNDLRNGVAKAIEALGQGFIGHPKNDHLRRKLQESGDLSKEDFYRQLLRIVYRLLFLFVSEDRELLHSPDAPEEASDLYDRFYSMRRLREMALRIRGSKHSDLWHGLSLVFNALGQKEGCPELGLPGLGSFLWNADSTKDLLGPYQINVVENIEEEVESVFITNDDLLLAIRAIAYVEQDKVLRSVDYRNLGSEELGSVYESLLELHPSMHIEAKSFELTTAAGNERKTTGSYYTPDSLVQCLLDSALDPVVEERLKGKKGEAAEEALLSLKVCDPACGSGHFLIAASHRLARHLARTRTGESEPSPEDYQHALRDVIGHCIYGVDINPMATELCKVSLWLEALEPGKPLSFLNHRIHCGNSLLGTTPRLLSGGIPDDAFKPIEGDDKDICKEYKKKNKDERTGQGYLFDDEGTSWIQLGDLASSYMKIDTIQDNDIEGIQRKQKQYEDLVNSDQYLFGRLLADAWCAAFVWKKTKEKRDAGFYPITQSIFEKTKNTPYSLSQTYRNEIKKYASQFQFFHWHISFPDVFHLPKKTQPPENKQTGWNGGFDVVLGNPPWGGVLSENILEICKFKFKNIIVRMIDSYIFFSKMMFDHLSSKGRFGIVLPDGALYQSDVEQLRRYFLENGSICLIVNAGDVFEGVSRPAALIAGTRLRTELEVLCSDWTRATSTRWFNITQSQLSKFPGGSFSVSSQQSYSILEKILSLPFITLDNAVDVHGIQRGVSPDLKEAFIIENETAQLFQIEEEYLKEVFTGGRDIKKFSANTSSKYLIYTTRNDDFENLPGVCAFIDTYKDRIKCKEVSQGKHPVYALHRPREKEIFLKKEKIVGVITEDQIVVAVDEKERFATDAVYLFSPIIEYNIHYLVGLLNSSLYSFLYSLYCPETGRVFAQVKPTILKTLPVPTLKDSSVESVEAITQLSHEIHKSNIVTEDQLTSLDNLVFQAFQLNQNEQNHILQHIATKS